MKHSVTLTTREMVSAIFTLAGSGLPIDLQTATHLAEVVQTREPLAHGGLLRQVNPARATELGL